MVIILTYLRVHKISYVLKFDEHLRAKIRLNTEHNIVIVAHFHFVCKKTEHTYHQEFKKIVTFINGWLQYSIARPMLETVIFNKKTRRGSVQTKVILLPYFNFHCITVWVSSLKLLINTSRNGVTITSTFFIFIKLISSKLKGRKIIIQLIQIVPIIVS